MDGDSSCGGGGERGSTPQPQKHASAGPRKNYKKAADRGMSPAKKRLKFAPDPIVRSVTGSNQLRSEQNCHHKEEFEALNKPCLQHQEQEDERPVTGIIYCCFCCLTTICELVICYLKCVMLKL
ncbi:uncharacterized protein [Triticum aestivum]|uniref:uncharacterized protein n=1 Tax=Triticum aestivum TaxID=4565 RepID=UPI001D015D71|nr:uncharacterized protein LOC123147677 [Triticum aestivum]